MANHFSHASLPYPVKNARFSVLVPYLDADGDPTDPGTPDTEISKDAGAFADCAEEVSTITGSNGMGYITLSGAEMDCVMAAIAAKVTTGPKNTLATLYPQVLPVLFSGTAQAGVAGSLTLATDIPAIADLLIGCIVKTTGGTGGGGAGGANNQARVITDFTTGRVASVVPNWETAPDGTTTYEVLLTERALLSYVDLKLWLGSAPNALQSGRVDSYIGALADGVLTAAKAAAGFFDAVWSVAARVLTAGTNIVLAKGTGVTGFNDLSAAQVNTEVNAAIADARLDELLAADSDIDGAAPPAVGSVFHELLSKTAGSFTFDQTTDSLEAQRDNHPANFALLSIDVNGRGDLSRVLGAAINSLISGRVDVNVQAMGTDVMTPAAAQAAFCEEIADALLNRNIAGGSNSGRLVKQALRRLRNRVAIAAGTMTVYQEDDSTPDHTAAVTTAAGNPVSEVDPA